MRYRHLKRTAIAVLVAVAAVMLVVLGLVTLLRSEAVRSRGARWIEARIARTTGVECTIGRLGWGVVPPRLLLERVEASGSGIGLEVERAAIDLAGLHWIGRRIELGGVVVDGVRLRVDRLPRPRRGRRSPVRIDIRHLDLRRVEIEGVAVRPTLHLEAHGLEASWAPDRDRTRGFATIESLGIRARSLEPFAVNVAARFALADTLEIERFRVRAKGLAVDGSGRMIERRLLLAADGSVDLAELGKVVRAKRALAGQCAVHADLDTERADLLRVEASAPSVRAAIFPFEGVRGRLSMTRRRLDVDILAGRLHGGEVRGRYHLASLKKPRPQRVEARIDGMALAGFLGDLKVPPAGLTARAEIEGELEWVGKEIRAGKGRATARLEPAAGRLPVGGVLEGALTPEGLLHLSGEGLRVGGSVVAWQGPLTIGTWEPSWSIRVEPARLAEIGPMVNAWVKTTVIPPEIGGDGELQVDLAGPWRRLRVGLRLEAKPLLYTPMRFDRVVAEATIDGDALELGPTRFRIGGGSGEVAGRIAWRGVPPDDELGLSWRARTIPLAAVAGWLGLERGISGEIAFTGGLRGALDSPRGSWAVGVVGAEVAGQGLGDGSGELDLAEGRFTLRGLAFTEGLAGTAWWDVTRGRVGGEARWTGAPLDRLGPTLAKILGGEADLDASFELALGGRLTGHLAAAARGAEVEVDAGVDRVTATATIVDAARASVVLGRDAGGGLSGNGSVELLEAKELVARLRPGVGVPLEGSGRAALDVRWPDGDWPLVEGHLERLALRLDGRPLSLVEPIDFTLSSRGLDVGGLRVALPEGEVFARCRIGADGGLAGNLSGTLDALLLRFLLPEWEPAGEITGVVELLGTASRPLLEGVARLSQGSFRIPGGRAVVSGITGTVLLSSDEVELEGVNFRFMHGSGRCAGTIRWRDGRPSLDLDGSIASLEYPLLPGLAPRLGGSWRLDGPGDALELGADLRVERAALRRRDDIASILLDWLEAPSQPEGEGGIGLDLHVEAERTIEASSAFLNLVGSASLAVGGSSAAPGVVGTLELEQGGAFTFQGVRYELEHGTLTFSDPLRIDPVVDVEARAWVQSYEISVRLNGTVERLVPTLTSDPPLPEAEIYSLLALGFRNETVGGGAVGVGLASTILTRQINAEIERRARTLLPVDQVRVDPFAESSTGNPTARVTMVKQLNPKWTIVLQSNLSANREEVVVSRWFLGPGVFLEATRDVDGTYALDLKLRRRY